MTPLEMLIQDTKDLDLRDNFNEIQSAFKIFLNDSKVTSEQKIAACKLFLELKRESEIYNLRDKPEIARYLNKLESEF